MCTVSVVPRADGFRLLCNRDEQRQRPAALAPTRHSVDNTTAVYPIDPVGGGTWVGVNDAGLAVALLNRSPSGMSMPPSYELSSRGLIAVALLAIRTVQEASAACASLTLPMFNPFRVVVVQGKRAATLTSDGRTLTLLSFELLRPFMVTSSSLGDDLVTAPRAALFERLVVNAHRAGDERRVLDGQARFHAHRWPDRGAVSVMMERPDAHTVSRTAVSVSGRDIELHYDALDGTTQPSEHLP